MRFLSLSVFLLVACASLIHENVYAATEAASVKQQKKAVPQPPKLKALSDQELEALIDKANKGDEAAQKEVVTRYHWSNFSDAFLRKVNIGSWNKIEEKAQKDYQFAYVLMVRNQLKKFPSVIKAIEANADQGDAAFQNLMGVIFSQSGFSEGKWVGFEKYRLSAKQGYAIGQFNLGAAYENGFGVAKNDKKAFDLYKKSAEQGYALAEFSLGSLYFEGRGVDEDMVKAVEWIEKSAAQGYPQAQEFLQFIKAGGWDGNNKAKNSFAFTQLAAEKGSIYAQRTLGQRLHKALGVKRDDQKAIEWWQKAADQGDKESLLALGVYYLEEGKDPEKAIKQFQKAADLGDEDAKSFLGIMYINLSFG